MHKTRNDLPDNIRKAAIDLLCKRRSKNPSMKQPSRSVAPE